MAGTTTLFRLSCRKGYLAREMSRMHGGSGGIAYEGWNLRRMDVVLSRGVGVAVSVGELWELRPWQPY